MSITSTLEIHYLDDSEPIEIGEIRDHVSGLLERDGVHIAALG